MRGDLVNFLKKVHLERLSEDFERHGVRSLDDLGMSTLEALHADPDVQLTPEEEQELSDSTVQRYRQRLRKATTRLMRQSAHVGKNSEHYIFLSHYKAEAASSAALMEENLNRLLQEEILDVVFQAPVFLDSENLLNLGDLNPHVTHSHNFLLLLTKGVLTRPWCLLECVIAVRSKANILPVIIEAADAEQQFAFPDDFYYERLLAGEELDESTMDFLEEQDVSLEELESSLRQVFAHIAASFSPAKPTVIRQAELKKLLAQCSLRSKDSQRQLHFS